MFVVCSCFRHTLAVMKIRHNYFIEVALKQYTNVPFISLWWYCIQGLIRHRYTLIKLSNLVICFWLTDGRYYLKVISVQTPGSDPQRVPQMRCDNLRWLRVSVYTNKYSWGTALFIVEEFHRAYWNSCLLLLFLLKWSGVREKVFTF